MKKYSGLFLLMLVLFAACEKVSDLSDEASVVDFQVLSHTPESAIVGKIYRSGEDIIIPVAPQEGLFPFTAQTSLVVSSSTHKVLGAYTGSEDLVFSSGETEIPFHLIAESGMVHPYVISLYPLDTGADIIGFAFDGSEKTTVILDAWNAIVYISDPAVDLTDGGSHTISNVVVTLSEGATYTAEPNYTFENYEDVKIIAVTSADGQTQRSWKLQLTGLVQIPNSDFESWGEFKVEGSGIVYTINPIPGQGEGWATANNSFVLGAMPIDRQGGNAAQLTTKIQNAFTFGNLIASGSLFTGEFHLMANSLNDSRAMTYFGVPYTLRPSAMEVDLRYEAGDTLCQAVKEDTRYHIEPIDGTDCGHAWIELLRWKGNSKFEYHGRHSDDVTVLGRGELVLDGTNGSFRTWKRYSIPIEYYDETSLPTHIAIVFSSSWKGDEYIGAPGSVMEVDNVQLIY